MDYKVLLIEPDVNLLRKQIEIFKNHNVNIIGVSDFEEAFDALKKDGTIHVVLTEFEVPLYPNIKETIKGNALFTSILKLRYEVNVFLYTSDKNADDFKSHGLLSGYFYKGDNDYEDIVSRITNEVYMSKNRAPFFEALKEYAKESKDSWHTPGHASGYSVKKSLWMQWIKQFL